MKGFKASRTNAKVKTRKNRNEFNDSILYTYFIKCRREPEFMFEDLEFNVDAELALDFAKATA